MYLWNSRPKVFAIDLPTLVLPTPGGPTKHRIGPEKTKDKQTNKQTITNKNSNVI